MLQSPRASSASYEKAARVDAVRWWRNWWWVINFIMIAIPEGGMLKKNSGSLSGRSPPADVESVPDIQSGEAELRCSKADCNRRARQERITAQRTYLSLKRQAEGFLKRSPDWWDASRSLRFQSHGNDESITRPPPWPFLRWHWAINGTRDVLQRERMNNQVAESGGIGVTGCFWGNAACD